MNEAETYEFDGGRVCRLHRTPLVFDPGWAFDPRVNYAGIGHAGDAFSNAKWGHPATPKMAGHEIVGLWHCPDCESERQRWLAAQGS
jgi:hypothetical protein